MPTTPLQSPPLRRSSRHDNSRRNHERSQADIRKDVRRKSAKGTKTTTKQQGRENVPRRRLQHLHLKKLTTMTRRMMTHHQNCQAGMATRIMVKVLLQGVARTGPAMIRKNSRKMLPKTSDTTKTQKKGARPKTSAAVEGGRMPNYSEDGAVAHAHVTVDPIQGVGEMLQQKELVESGQDIQPRIKDSVKQRWKKKISKSMQLWNKYYKQLKGLNKSGWNEEKYIEEAGNLYKDETGELFRSAKCVLVLHKLPKFDPIVAGSATLMPCDHADSLSDENEEVHEGFAIVSRAARKRKVNNNVPPQGSSMERPVGMKKAKLIKKIEDA